ncbi:hypothetical protein L6452_28613 [Arctium lappa]|uniref:Uncharacterized protein n=1 Tax=Arctium lappa TaxID=4217 RepID=A0ACB8ZYY4_ARCLA|nr:hypothetical protein L6452_28613 [Arctium lappa]
MITIISASDVSEALPIVLEQTGKLFAEETDPDDEKKSAVIENIYKRNATGVYKIEGSLTEIKSSGFHHLPRNSTSSEKVKKWSIIEGEDNEKEIRLGKNLFIGFWIVFGVNYLLWISIGP